MNNVSAMNKKGLERHRFPASLGEDIVSRMAVVRLEDGDTLPDIARHFGLGLNAVSTANPGVDIWVPISCPNRNESLTRLIITGSSKLL
jgi:L,D-transpeptidase ErfK/SrfK